MKRMSLPFLLAVPLLLVSIVPVYASEAASTAVPFLADPAGICTAQPSADCGLDQLLLRDTVADCCDRHLTVCEAFAPVA